MVTKTVKNLHQKLLIQNQESIYISLNGLIRYLRYQIGMSLQKDMIPKKLIGDQVHIIIQEVVHGLKIWIPLK